MSGDKSANRRVRRFNRAWVKASASCCDLYGEGTRFIYWSAGKSTPGMPAGTYTVENDGSDGFPSGYRHVRPEGVVDREDFTPLSGRRCVDMGWRDFGGRIEVAFPDGETINADPSELDALCAEGGTHE